MLNNNINKELERAAVYERDFEKVKVLLSTGANVNLRVEQDKSTLLHNTNSVEITKELLLRGAAVNARNMYSETSLHSAITLGRELALVRELLKNGADVNATNRKGNTPLNHAVKRNSSEAIIKELLEYGADINIRNRESRLYDNHSTPLDNAVGSNLAYAELLIKFTLIRNFNADYRKIINLTPYKEFSTYSKLSHYLDRCICEIAEMKKDKMNNGISLYGFYVEKDLNKIASYTKSREITECYKNKYPIYNDLIINKLEYGRKREELLNKLDKLKVYEKEVILNLDCKRNIAKYLSNDDLLNLIVTDSPYEAFSNKASQSSIQQPITKLGEATAFINSHASPKKARLEL
ncbi:ankyrin repeat domain-containing protein [Candidatus Mesenet endosymbiont of Agriotes lineatus]|uniref:ankyrin repeat domain-containing protein n=1 Tax=Candidatus Mesenet endosymbiont of Agriotes lineatus TaxID=3077948 RepID=UPI0030D14D4B